MPKRRDSNHALIREALESAGLTVYDVANAGGGLPDLICTRDDGKCWLVEVKTDDGVFTPAEVKFILRSANPAYRVFSDPQKAAEAVRK